MWGFYFQLIHEGDNHLESSSNLSSEKQFGFFLKKILKEANNFIWYFCNSYAPNSAKLYAQRLCLIESLNVHVERDL